MNYVWEEIWKSDPYNRPEERVSRAKRRLESIRNALEPRVDLGRVIEFGCGDGSFACALASDERLKVEQYIGFDRSSTAIARARKQPSDSELNFNLADLASLQLPAGTADTVFMLGVLEHLQNPETMLRTIRGACSAGARVVFTTSNTRSMMYVNRRIREWMGRWPYGYQRNYTTKEFCQMLDAHFEVLYEERIHGAWDFPLSAVVDRGLSAISNDFGRYILIVCKPKS
jgi:2-polyprenyl-3-methyl-5-hydroxy-6-metoxy-1,4-benzoquinol methylase